MQMKNRLIIFTILSAVFLTSCSNNQAQIISLEKKQEVKIEAIKAIKTVGGAFQNTLNHKVKEGGLTNAANFCSTNASDLEKKVSKTLSDGVTVRRITNKPRNIKNKASSEEEIVLDEIKSKLLNGEKVDMLVKQKSANGYQVYKPIKMSAKCLNCHGNVSKRNSEAYEIISNKYPNDKAINYDLGDFRGAFLVEISK